jgi:hypothetical protein
VKKQEQDWHNKNHWRKADAGNEESDQSDNVQDLDRLWTHRFKQKKWLVLIRQSLAGFDSTADSERPEIALRLPVEVGIG